MATPIFSRIEQRSVPQEVVDLIRQAIVSGRLDFGQHLTEISLSEQMSVSRIPIREALRQLEQEGLVTRFNNRGCFVVSFTDQDVREVFSLRATLEVMAVEWAVPRMNDADIEHLRGMIGEQRAAVERQDYETLAYLDMKFHEYICLKAQHSRLYKDWNAHHAQCQMLLNRRFRVFSDFIPEKVAENHTLLVEALARRDVPAAAELTRQFSARVERECIEVLHLLQPQHS